MKKIYVVVRWYDGAYLVEKVFSKRHSAEEFALASKDFEVLEFDVFE